MSKRFFKTLLLKSFLWTFREPFWQRCQNKFTEGWNFCAKSPEMISKNIFLKKVIFLKRFLETVKSSFDKHVEVYWKKSWKIFVQGPKQITKYFFSKQNSELYQGQIESTFENPAEKNSEKVDSIAPNVRENIEKKFRNKCSKCSSRQ